MIWKGKEREGKERGKERKGEEREGKERKGKAFPLRYLVVGPCFDTWKSAIL